MPNKKNPPDSEEADFSGYFQKEDAAIKKEQKFSPIQELPNTKIVTKRIKFLIAIFVILSLAQFILFYITQKAKNPGIPEGYQIISVPNSPPMVIPTKP